MKPDRILAAAKRLSDFYSVDLDGDFGNELVQFQLFLSSFLDQKEESCSLEQFMYTLIFGKKVQSTFPNVETALKIYLTLMIANVSGEQSFFKLKFIKNLMQTTMGQTRLNHLSIMSMESDILRSLNLSDIIHSFAATKARKVLLVNRSVN